MHNILENRVRYPVDFIAATTALICIHWQNDLVQPEGAFGSMFSAEILRSKSLERTKDVLAACRSKGVFVVHVLATYQPDLSNLIVNNALFRTVKSEYAFVKGTPGWHVCDELQPQQGEFVVEHSRINCFYGTDLSSQLRARGIVNTAFTGVATNVAVDHSVREAVQEGFNTFLLEDCCCSSNSTFHEAALMTLNALSSYVCSAEEFVAAIDR